MFEEMMKKKWKSARRSTNLKEAMMIIESEREKALPIISHLV